MTVATGVAKLVAFKKETYLANIVTVSTTGGTYLRRVSSDIDLSKEDRKSVV